MKRCLPMFALLAVLFVLPACGDQPQKNAAPSVADGTRDRLIQPEELISRLEAESLMNASFKGCEKSEQAAVGQSICLYESPDSDRFFQISIVQDAAFTDDMLQYQNAATIYAATKEMLMDVELVENMGDDAFIAIPGIHVLKGTRYLTIAVGNIGDEANRVILREAGKTALDNLEKLTRK